jgi:hypothetical protein
MGWVNGGVYVKFMPSFFENFDDSTLPAGNDGCRFGDGLRTFEAA